MLFYFILCYSWVSEFIYKVSPFWISKGLCFWNPNGKIIFVKDLIAGPLSKKIKRHFTPPPVDNVIYDFPLIYGIKWKVVFYPELCYGDIRHWTFYLEKINSKGKRKNNIQYEIVEFFPQLFLQGFIMTFLWAVLFRSDMVMFLVPQAEMMDRTPKHTTTYTHFRHF